MINARDCRITRKINGTAGGSTFWVILPDKTEAKTLCFRKMHNKPKDIRCTNSAGYGTDHLGFGACKYHGGGASTSKSVQMLKTGNNPRSALRHGINEKVKVYMQQDRKALLDLTEELAITKAIFSEFMESFPVPSNDGYGSALYRFQQLMGSLGSLVEKASRIDQRNTITAAQVLYLRAVIADMFMKYIPDVELRERASKELLIKMGGGEDVPMLPSELPSVRIDYE